jgi:hypothetical protein
MSETPRSFSSRPKQTAEASQHRVNTFRRAQVAAALTAAGSLSNAYVGERVQMNRAFDAQIRRDIQDESVRTPFVFREHTQWPIAYDTSRPTGSIVSFLRAGKSCPPLELSVIDREAELPFTRWAHSRHEARIRVASSREELQRAWESFSSEVKQDVERTRLSIRGEGATEEQATLAAVQRLTTLVRQRVKDLRVEVPRDVASPSNQVHSVSYRANPRDRREGTLVSYPIMQLGQERVEGSYHLADSVSFLTDPHVTVERDSGSGGTEYRVTLSVSWIYDSGRRFREE